MLHVGAKQHPLMIDKRIHVSLVSNVKPELYWITIPSKIVYLLFSNTTLVNYLIRIIFRYRKY